MAAPVLAYSSLAIEEKHEGKIPIQRLQIFSERCSGSNYVTALLVQHFRFANCVVMPEKRPLGLYDVFDVHDKQRVYLKALLYPYRYKHFPPQSDLEGSDDCLFVVIFRNPYDWARSFFLSPWDGAPEVRARSLAEFIRLPWKTEPTSQVMRQEVQYNPWVDRNHSDGSLFSTIWDLRTSKIKDMLSLQQKVKNIYYVNYESVLANPKQFLTEIETIYGLRRTGPYRPIKDYKGRAKNGVYQKKQYTPFSEEDLEYIHQKLDLELEAWLAKSFLSL